MIPHAEISAIILAGGRARRMGGVEKGLVSLRGRPLIRHVIDVIRPQAAHLFISANRRFDTYSALGPRVVADRWPDLRGPLAGVASVLMEVTTPYVLISPCDTPFLPQDLAARLGTCLLKSRACAAVAHSAGRLQPLCALMRSDMAPELTAYVAAGRAGVGQWWIEQAAVRVEFSDGAAFANINTLEEVRDAEAMHGVL